MIRAFICMIFLGACLPAFAAKNTVAVLYFSTSTTSEKLKGLEVGLAQMLITDLSGKGEFDVVEREKLQAILDELELGHNGIADPASAAKIGKLLGARYMLMGSYMEIMNTLRVDARLVEVETSKIVGAHGVNGAPEAFMSMEAELAEFALKTLASSLPKPDGIPASAPRPAPTTREGTRGAPQPVGPAEGIDAPDPKALEAAVAFSEGLIFMDSGSKPKARESFQAALAAKPDLVDAKIALAKLEI